MATNLCRDTCERCGYKVMLSDIRGKPVEFRRNSVYAPYAGVRFDCQCGAIYFVWFERSHEYWDDPHEAYVDPFYLLSDGTPYPNKEKGRFVRKTTFRGEEKIEQTGYYRIDMAYYASFRDEDGPDPENPSRLLLGEAEDARLDNY